MAHHTFPSTMDITGIVELAPAALRAELATGFFTEQHVAGVARDTLKDLEYAVEVVAAFGWPGRVGGRPLPRAGAAADPGASGGVGQAVGGLHQWRVGADG